MDAFLSAQLDMYCGVLNALANETVCFQAQNEITACYIQVTQDEVKIDSNVFIMSSKTSPYQIFTSDDQICLEYKGFYATCLKEDLEQAKEIIQNIFECQNQNIE
ncbi:hypothetical protein SS50377_23999 [Spironucleus salmonicida]|uniref:Uncharacterized protein n=1 Tax=Spironucleus salmonicida TaxID=348837 RepID=V6LEG5_9EUKA|nr:hypothetical protein SS50377_23999 [Spironucleus salmonicida]|eukprot:EST42905.1 Hypothetical protein SS50377_17439 [Spironucleus salmonicida]